jgi:outer membrane autotransporter protein
MSKEFAMLLHATPFARKTLLCHAIAVSLALSATPSTATVLLPGQQHTARPGDTPEAFTISGGGRMTLLPGAATLRLDILNSTLTATDGSVVSDATGGNDYAVVLANGTTATIQGGSIRSLYGTGLAVAGVGNLDGDDKPASAVVTGTDIYGGSRGATVANGGMLLANGARFSGAAADGTGIEISNGTAKVTGQTRVLGGLHGVVLFSDARGGAVGDTGRTLVVDDSVVEGTTGSAVFVQFGVSSAAPHANIIVQNGGQLVGGNGVAVEVGRRMSADVAVTASSVEGDIVATAQDASANVVLGDQAYWRGTTRGAVAMGIDATAGWTATAPAEVTSLRLDGTLAFDGTGAYMTLDVRGDMTGQGGSLVLNTLLNEGGAPGDQATDRLLVHGDVATSGTTFITVAPRGDGALTDANHDGVVDNNEGISLVQVAGASRADAFALKGNYVAAGPWQYTLHAFGPGQADPAQGQLGSDALNWDYRLANRYVKECGDECGPVDPPVDPEVPPPVVPEVPEVPGNPEPPIDDRPAVVPQLPSYMLAPLALQNYGSLMNDSLHRRLGEIRDSAYGANAGGEVFARYVGGNLDYTRNLSFDRFGYDFAQQINVLQLGGSIVAVEDDEGSLRAGWAMDHGTTRVTPDAADGGSRAKYYGNGGSAWVTWQHGSGFWVDGVVGITRYHGDVGTDLRGSDVGTLKAQGWTMSVEMGKPLPLGGDWTVEPQFQLRRQNLAFRDFRDADGLDIHLGSSALTTTRLGIQVGRTANQKLVPYGRLDLIHTTNGAPTVTASSEAWNMGDSFQTGRTGNAYRVAAGATSQLTDHVQVYGEGTYEHFVGGYGLRGWSGNLGIRVTF